MTAIYDFVTGSQLPICPRCDRRIVPRVGDYCTVCSAERSLELGQQVERPRRHVQEGAVYFASGDVLQRLMRSECTECALPLSECECAEVMP
jgi:hypothetical protein